LIPMAIFRSLRAKEIKGILRNYHFWAIALIFSAIAIFYYRYSYPAIIFTNDFTCRLWQLWIFEFKSNMHGILFIIPMLYATICFRWYGILVTWISCMVVVFPYLMNWNQNWINQLINIIFLSVPFLVFGFITLNLKQIERGRRITEEREAERQAYISQVFKAQENERQRIAYELHDDTAQKLLAIANRAQSLLLDEYGKITQPAKNQAEWIRDMVLQLSEDIRKMSRDLRPSILDNIGLLPALAWLVNQLERDDGINTRLVVDGTERKFSPEADVIIFRIVQEALNNIRRHSKATKATVTLEFAPKTIRLTVSDNGKGFKVPEKMVILTVGGKLGLSGMQQRTNFLDGTFDIQSELGKGTTISIELKA
jgi:two-component system, NarL family, sensor histidine kinase DegS